eukprot:SAG31_NODE_562_length_14085_cov_164.582869_4_plen_204_part_00
MDFPGKKFQAQRLQREALLDTSVIGHWPGSFSAVQSEISSVSSIRSSLSSGLSSVGSLAASSHTSFGNGQRSVFDFQRTPTASSARSPRRRNQVLIHGEIGPAYASSTLVTGKRWSRQVQAAMKGYVHSSVEAERSLRRLWTSQQLRLPIWSDAAVPTSQLQNPAAAGRTAKFPVSCAAPLFSPRNARTARPRKVSSKLWQYQ